MTKRENYFLRQKLMGLVLLVLMTVLSPVLWEYEMAICLVLMVPLGLWLLLSKEMLIVDDYYDEVKGDRP